MKTVFQRQSGGDELLIFFNGWYKIILKRSDQRCVICLIRHDKNALFCLGKTDLPGNLA